MLKRCFITAAIFVLLAPALAAAATITENDYARLVTLMSPAISPDGKHAVLVVERVNWNEDRRDADLVLVDLSTRAQRVLVHGRKGLSDPVFSPDGAQIAFLANDGSKEKRSEVFVMPANGGKERQVTHIKADVDQFIWRPDGKAIAFAAQDPEAEKKGADRFRDSFVFTTEPIVARSQPKPVHLFEQRLRGGDAAQLTFGTQSVAAGEAESTLSWSPDGKTIAFTLCPDAILNDESNSHVALLDVATKRVRGLTGHTAYESNALFAPDGSHVSYLYSEGDSQVNQTRLYVTTLDGGAGSAVSASVDRPVSDIAWSPDGTLFFSVPDRSTHRVYRTALGGAPASVFTGSPGSSLNNAIAKDGTIVFIDSATKQAPELFARHSDGSTTQLTTYNGFVSKLDLASTERITYPTTLGIEGDAVLYLPPGYTPGHKYPLSVYIHGGPTSSSTLGFDFWAQTMAARGWLVLRPNYRGSDDLGLAYMRGVLYDPEDGPGKDIMAAVDAVRARGIVDDHRVVVSGWSYGGIMTAWMISKYHIWNAAVSGASVNDWITDYGTADDSGADVALFHGSPYVAGNADEWRAASSISYVAGVTTPVLILSDVGDNRDSFATSSMYWRALRDNKKDATLRVWPIDGHFPRDPVRTVDVYHAWIQYLAEHVR